MRLLHLYWPHLPLRLARARRSDSFPTDRPVVLGGQPWTDGTVIDADPAARALGVRRGIPLGSAHRLAPEAAFLDPEPDADAASVEAAFEAPRRVQPGARRQSRDQADPAFGLLEVQVDGLERLWGTGAGARRAARRARSPAACRGAAAGDRRDPVRGDRRRRQRHAAGAPDRPARRRGRVPRPVAGLSAHHGPGRPRPAAAVRAAPDRGGRGAAAVGARRPVRRGGGALHARAHGEEIEPVPAPPRPGAPRARRCRSSRPVEELDSLRFVLHRLAGALADQLEARGTAAARGHLRLRSTSLRPPGTPAELSVEQRFPEPTADAEAIERLLFARLERTPPPAPVARVELELAGVEPAVGQQLPLFVPQAARNARLGWQLARLALTFGEDRVRRVALADPDAPLAEARWTWRP